MAQTAKDNAVATTLAKTRTFNRAETAEDAAQLAFTIAEKASTSTDPDNRVTLVANFKHSLFSSVDLSPPTKMPTKFISPLF